MKTPTSPLLRKADPTRQALAVRRRLAWPLLALLPLLLASAGWAATRTVTSLADDGPETLRQRIIESGLGDTIEFAVSGTITLTSGELVIQRSLTIRGPGAANLIVSGNHSSRVFHIVAGTVTLSDLTITNGFVPGGDGANGTGEPNSTPAQAGGAGSGAGIYNGDNLTLVNCFVVGNLAQGGTGGGGYYGFPGLPGASGGPGEGGGVYNNGSLTVSNSTFYQNECVGGKGGLGGAGAGFFGAGDGGPGGAAGAGGIYNDGTLMLLNSTFADNRVSGGAGGDGGGSTFGSGGNGGAGGSAFGGGVYGFSGSAVNSTISGNTAAGGSGGAGGIGNGGGQNGRPGVNGSGEGGGVDVRSLASAIMINTIVAGNNGVFSPDVSGFVISQGHNFIGVANGSGPWVASDITGSIASLRDPQLRPLQDAGGPTLTLPLHTTSPAIDAGDDAVLGPPYSLVTDQRGAPRRYNAHVDIGAYEFGAPLPPGPGKLQFSSAAYSVAEDADTLLITVLRSQGSLGVVTVHYATSDGTATAPSDYAATSGTLAFANGEVSKTFSIRINNDGSVEGNEVFNLTLSSPSNTVLVSPGTAQVTILDNDRPQHLVSTFNDSGGGSLRQAISNANSGDLILFAPLVRGTIRLTSGELLIDKPLSILGPGAAALAISGNTNSRVFHIGESGDVDIYGLTITEGRVVGTNGANGVGAGSGQDGESACGGGVLSEGRLTLSDCMITSNGVAGGRGGNGGVFINSFPAVGNGGAGGGGFGSGIYSSEGFLEVRRCSVLGNVASGGSGGAGGFNNAAHKATGNGGAGGASLGGGVFELGSSALENCTVSGNQTIGGRGGNGGPTNILFTPGPSNGGNGGVARGGALHGAFMLSSCTIAANASLAGAGGSHTATGVDGVLGTVDGGGVFATPSLAVLNTLIAGNTGSPTSPDVAGTVTSAGWNLIGITDGSSGWTTNDFLGNSVFPLSALLSPCQDNGGPVWTMCPLSGSPARDKGRSDLPTDARGGRRILDFSAIPNAPGGDGSDIGALEVDSLFRILSIMRIIAVTSGDSFVQVKFKTDPGNTYRLQQTSMITNRVWTNIVGTVTGNGQNLEATDFGPLPTSRFYRVRAD